MMREIPDSVPRMVLLCSEGNELVHYYEYQTSREIWQKGRNRGHQFVGNHHNNPWWPEFRLWFSQGIVIFKKWQGYYVLCRAMHWGVVVGHVWIGVKDRRPKPSSKPKSKIFKQLWGRFEELFISYYGKQIGIYMELPRGCEYWNNDEVRFPWVWENCKFTFSIDLHFWKNLHSKFT